MPDSLIDLSGLQVGPEDFLFAVLETTAQPIWVVDPDGVIRFANPAAIAALGYDSADELFGRVSHETIHHSHPDGTRYPAADCPMLLPRATGETVTSDLDWFFRRDGSMFPVSYISVPLEIRDGRGAVVAFTDIENRLRVERELRDRDERLAAEQASLRRIAALVAGGAESAEIFAAVAREVVSLLELHAVQISRYEPDGTATVIGAFSDRPQPFEAGTRWPLDEGNIFAQVKQTALPARRDDHADLAGAVAVAACAHAIRSGAGAPIIIDGDVWGVMSTWAREDEPLPDHVEDRLAELTALIAAAFSNTASRDEVARLADEQAALRRVATLVAQESSPVELLATVAEEVARVLDLEAVGMLRFEPDGTATLVAQSDTPWDPPPPGTRFTLEGENVVTAVVRTREAARLDDWANATGPVAEMAHALGIRSSVATPIVVEGRLWGTLIAVTSQSEPLPPETDSRIAEFTKLVATAIANAGARDELAASEARARDLAGEQAALRRVATLVAKGVSSDELFAAVTREAADVLDVPVVALQRYEADRMFTMVSIAGETSFTVGSRWPVEDEGLAGMILATGGPARKQGYTTMPGPLGAALRDGGLTSAVGVPVVVQGSIWGFMTAGARPGKPTPDGTEERLARFTELVATAIADSQARDRLAQLAYEQSALRRVATMVAHAPASEQLFSTVAREVASVLDVPGVIVTRYDADGLALTLGEAFRPDLAGAERFLGVGTRMPRDAGSLAAQVFDTHGPARVDDFSTLPGAVGDLARAARLGSGCAGPIVVNGAVWGKMCAFSRVGAVLPAGTEDRLQDFIDLVATAIANYEARAELAASEARARELADEQAALRRVATLVAREPASEAFFSAVAREVASVLNVPGALVERFEADGASVSIGAEYDSDLSGAERLLGVGVRTPPDSGSLTAQVFQTKQAARVDDFSTLPGPVGDAARGAGIGSGCAGPIVVNRGLWGMLAVFSRAGTLLPAGTENRLHDFIELVATAISNYEARAELAASEARARELADEQAALRRVATLVARGVSPDEMFSAVTNEMAQLFGSPQACVGRFEPDGSAMVVVGVSHGIRGISIGSRWELEDYMASTGVFRTGRPVRVERSDLEHVSGPMAAVLREIGAVSTVGAPIVVEGKQWGFVTVSDVNKRLPADAERRLEKFAELVATAIANAESRAELAASEVRARKLAEEQAALRRVATLVAEGAAPTEVFDAVIAEVGQLLGAAQVGLARYENEREISVLAIRGQTPEVVGAGARLPIDGDSVNARILRTGRSVRLNFAEEGSGSIAEIVRRDNVNATVGAPIVVEGALWGMIGASWRGDERPPADAEERLVQFAELLDTAIANADSRDQLTASRARVLATADEARRRVVRDLHDGAQQRLVHTIVTLKLAKRALSEDDGRAEALLAEALDHAELGNAELRELSHGILPSVLTRGGLRAGIDALVSRLDIPVDVRVMSARVPTEIEASAYFIVAEALTNVVKHSQATTAEVTAAVDNDRLTVEVRDDGIGGADPTGHGLVGISDRAAALGGRLRIDSSPGGGTELAAELPLRV